MKGYFDSRITQSLTESANASYNIDYEYDEAGRIIKETVSGSISRETTYTYDIDDNITSEIINVDGKVITKAYTYDDKGNITKVAVEVENATA